MTTLAVEPSVVQPCSYRRFQAYPLNTMLTIKVATTTQHEREWGSNVTVRQKWSAIPGTTEELLVGSKLDGSLHDVCYIYIPCWPPA